MRCSGRSGRSPCVASSPSARPRPSPAARRTTASRGGTSTAADRASSRSTRTSRRSTSTICPMSSTKWPACVRAPTPGIALTAAAPQGRAEGDRGRRRPGPAGQPGEGQGQAEHLRQEGRRRIAPRGRAQAAPDFAPVAPARARPPVRPRRRGARRRIGSHGRLLGRGLCLAQRHGPQVGRLDHVGRDRGGLRGRARV